jgi:hypothetical protein
MGVRAVPDIVLDPCARCRSIALLQSVERDRCMDDCGATAGMAVPSLQETDGRTFDKKSPRLDRHQTLTGASSTATDSQPDRGQLPHRPLES